MCLKIHQRPKGGIMQKYESMVVLQPNLTEEQINNLVERISDIIKADANLESINNMGLRKLAYKIDNQYTDGNYFVFNFEADPGTEVLNELEHNYKIIDDIIRSIIVKRND